MRYLFVVLLYLFLTTNLCAEELPQPNEQAINDAVQQLQEDLNIVKENLLSQKEALSKQEAQVSTFMEETRTNSTGISKSLASLSETNTKLSAKVRTIEVSITELSGKFDELKTILDTQAEQIKQQTALLSSFESALAANKIELTEKVNTVDQGVTETKTQLTTLDQNVGGKLKELGYWLAFVALIGIIGIALGVIVRKRLASSKNQLENNLTNMRLQMEEENVKLDSKLVELLQSQIKMAGTSHTTKEALQTGRGEETVDHALPLKVGEEIFRMRQRLSALPDGTKGLKPLSKSLERLEDEFQQKGYELVDMLNKPFNDGMNVEARHIPSDDLAPGEQIITKIIKPQINFNGVAIQTAEIEVGTGG